MTKHQTPKAALINRLACSYTKALCQNPKDTLYANIERMVEENPVVAASLEMLAALQLVAKTIADPNGTDSDFEDAVFAAIASAKP